MNSPGNIPSANFTQAWERVEDRRKTEGKTVRSEISGQSDDAIVSSCWLGARIIQSISVSGAKEGLCETNETDPFASRVP